MTKQQLTDYCVTTGLDMQESLVQLRAQLDALRGPNELDDVLQSLVKLTVEQAVLLGDMLGMVTTVVDYVVELPD